jgi:hypothetical protein
MRVTRRSRSPAASLRRQCRPRLESLEGRALLSNILVNSGYTTDDQSAPSVGMDPVSGAYVVVWQSKNQYSSSSGYDIYGQLYNADGTTSGSMFLVNTTTTNDQITPSVSMNASGNFVVTWASLDQVSSSSGYDIYGRFYSATSGASSEFLVNTTTTASQREPSVALNSDNKFVVTWMSEGQGPTQIGSGGGGGPGGGGASVFGGGAGALVSSVATTSYGGAGNSAPLVIIPALQGVMAQEFTTSGTTVTKYGNTEVTVNTFQSSPEGEIQPPTVGIDSSGDFAVAFSAEDANASFNGVQYDWDYAYARRYSDGATAIDSSQVMVNPNPWNNCDQATIAVSPDGDIVVVWSGGLGSSPTSPPPPPMPAGVYAQLWSMTPSATPGTPIVVGAPSTVGGKWNPAVAMNDSGMFEVTWQYADHSNGNNDIFARQFDSSGVALTGEVQVSDVNGVNNTFPAVGLDDDGDYFVAWQEPDSGGGGTSDIWGQLL